MSSHRARRGLKLNEEDIHKHPMRQALPGPLTACVVRAASCSETQKTSMDKGETP